LTEPLAGRSTEPGEETLAGLWSFTLQALAARVAHEINNALNGALMNVEVVRTRARPGVDSGSVAPFAQAAADQLAELARLTEALLALARAPRGTPDAALMVRHAAALLAPVLAHVGGGIEVAGAPSCPVGGDAHAARLAVVASLLAVTEATLGGVTAGAAGTVSADEPVRLVRCTTLADDPPTVEIAPRRGATLKAAVAGVLASAGVIVMAESGILRIALPLYRGP